jgi:hypothetical protein
MFLVDDDDYNQPPAAPLATNVPPGQARVEVLAMRYALGYGLWHPKDKEGYEQISGESCRHDNNRTFLGEFQIDTCIEVDEDEDEALLETMADIYAAFPHKTKAA